MAKKHEVICPKCGRTFDTNKENGWEYIDHSRRYVCPRCVRNKGKAKQISPSLYKTSGIILIVVSVIIFILALLLTLAVPPIGIVFIATSIAFFLLGRNYIRRAKRIVEATQTIEQ